MKSIFAQSPVEVVGVGVGVGVGVALGVGVTVGVGVAVGAGVDVLLDVKTKSSKRTSLDSVYFAPICADVVDELAVQLTLTCVQSSTSNLLFLNPP